MDTLTVEKSPMSRKAQRLKARMNKLNSKARQAGQEAKQKEADKDSQVGIAEVNPEDGE